jgi:hypothetical protein
MFLIRRVGGAGRTVKNHGSTGTVLGSRSYYTRSIISKVFFWRRLPSRTKKNGFSASGFWIRAGRVFAHREPGYFIVTRFLPVPKLIVSISVYRWECPNSLPKTNIAKCNESVEYLREFSFESRSIYHHVIIIVSSARNVAPRLERTVVHDGRSDARTQNFGPALFDEFYFEIIASVFGFRSGF